VHLLGLPPAGLALLAILLASFSAITYANHDEVTFQALFEVGCGIALFVITAYCWTYLSQGIQVSLQHVTFSPTVSMDPQLAHPKRDVFGNFCLHFTFSGLGIG
jgi:hypothetical protein